MVYPQYFPPARPAKVGQIVTASLLGGLSLLALVAAFLVNSRVSQVDQECAGFLGQWAQAMSQDTAAKCSTVHEVLTAVQLGGALAGVGIVAAGIWLVVAIR